MNQEGPQMASLQIVTPSATDMSAEYHTKFPILMDSDDDGRSKRTGTLWTASAHIITAVIGSGVLSLSWATAQLGWVIGPLVLIAFSLVTFYTSTLLTDCYRSPDPVKGKRNHTYMDAVKANLGSTQIWLCGLTQYANLYGTSIGYTITAAISMTAIKQQHCFHDNGREAQCSSNNNPFMILFGLLQLILCQVPDFDKLWWLSIVAAVMSFTYSSIALGLAIGKVAEGNFHGTLTGVPIGTVTAAQKVWDVFRALGNIAFAYSYSSLLIEIQDTVKSPPAENQTMKKATAIGVSVTTIFYMLCGLFGYAAFGNNAPGNFLSGFGYYEQFWLIDIANICIIVHLVGAYQVFVQPLFAFIEKWCFKKWPESIFLQMEYNVKLPKYGKYKLSLFRLVWRSVFVVTTTVISMLLPFFNDVVALLGAAGFWPLTVYFPVEMYIVQQRVPRFSSKWLLLKALSGVCFLLSAAAAVAAIEGVVQDLKTYEPFKTTYD